MATRTRKPATPKTVTVIARYFIRRNGHIVYTFRGSHGEEYCTTVVNGRATGCSCPARKPCKHMAHAEAKEQARTTPVEAAAIAGDRTYEQAVSKAYEALGATKNVQTAVYGSCGHLVKPGQEHDLCGGCYQRLYA
jgi:hypothetical protein